MSVVLLNIPTPLLDSSNGYTVLNSNTITPNTVLVFVLPNTNGSSGQVLTTDGDGHLYWTTPILQSQVDELKKEITTMKENGFTVVTTDN